jgi:hypothetical protein
MVLLNVFQDEVRDNRLYCRQVVSQQAQGDKALEIAKGSSIERIQGRAISFELKETHEKSNLTIIDLATGTTVSAISSMVEAKQAVSQGLHDLSGRLHERGICWSA